METIEKEVTAEVKTWFNKTLQKAMLEVKINEYNINFFYQKKLNYIEIDKINKLITENKIKEGENFIMTQIFTEKEITNIIKTITKKENIITIKY